MNSEKTKRLEEIESDIPNRENWLDLEWLVKELKTAWAFCAIVDGLVGDEGCRHTLKVADYHGGEIGGPCDIKCELCGKVLHSEVGQI